MADDMTLDDQIQYCKDLLEQHQTNLRGLKKNAAIYADGELPVYLSNQIAAEEQKIVDCQEERQHLEAMRKKSQDSTVSQEPTERLSQPPWQGKSTLGIVANHLFFPNLTLIQDLKQTLGYFIRCCFAMLLNGVLIVIWLMLQDAVYRLIQYFPMVYEDQITLELVRIVMFTPIIVFAIKDSRAMITRGRETQGDKADVKPNG
ncbi:MAG: hypothetical protein AAF639_07095 [Chloroflexota bacterium]